MTWLDEVFQTKKPIVAMCHLRALPGDPGYDPRLGMAYVIEKARADLLALQNGGVDAVMFSNEFSLPYLTKVATETVAAMARVIGELKADIRIPYGVNVLWDPRASFDLAVATDALFVREVFTGVYASDFGLWNTNCGEVIRHRAHIGGAHVRTFFNIFPEAARYLAERPVEDIARSTVFNNRPDALCVSGLIAGAATDSGVLERVKAAVPETMVFANTGVRQETVRRQLAIADGAIVGTTFKQDNDFNKFVDIARVSAFMKEVRDFRSGL